MAPSNRRSHIARWLTATFILTGCSGSPRTVSTPFPGLQPTRPIATALPAPTFTPDVTPVGTAQPIAAAIAQVNLALQGSDANAVAALMTDKMLLGRAPNGDVAQLLPRADALAWLQERWTPAATRSASAYQYSEHFELLAVHTSGWTNGVDMAHPGEIVFHLHRYGADGRGDASRGEWRIDGILY